VLLSHGTMRRWGEDHVKSYMLRSMKSSFVIVTKFLFHFKLYCNLQPALNALRCLSWTAFTLCLVLGAFMRCCLPPLCGDEKTEAWWNQITKISEEVAEGEQTLDLLPRKQSIILQSCQSSSPLHRFPRCTHQIGFGLLYLSCCCLFVQLGE
jgi:hypothetical protein